MLRSILRWKFLFNVTISKYPNIPMNLRCGCIKTIKTYLEDHKRLQLSTSFPLFQYIYIYIVDALRPKDPRCCQVDARCQPRLSSGSVVPAKYVRTHPPMVLLAMTPEIKLSAFFRDHKLTFFLVWRSFYIVSEALPSSLMVGRLFGSSWCPQGGGRAIITLQAAVRDRGRWLAIAPVLSFCRRRNVGCGRLSGMTQQGLLATVNDPDNISR